MAKDTGRKDAQRPLVWRLVDELIADLRLTPEDARKQVRDIPRLEVLFYAAKTKIDRLRDQGDGEAIEGIAFDDRTHTPFGVDVNLKTPKVPYKETVTATATGDFRHKKQTGGHGQFGHVTLDVAPLPRGSGVEFVDAVVGGSIPRNYIPAAEKGIYEAAQEGVLAGFPVVDIRARLFDGSFHPVDSSDICFKIAGAGALKKALADARPVLLEPIVKLKVTVPDNHTGDIISDLNNKRGRVLGISPEDGKNVIEAQVPQAEVLRYAIDLKSMTQGRGRYTYEFSHYEEVPSFVAPKVIAERQAQKEQQKAEKE